MKHRVRIHGKKPRSSQRRLAKPAPKKLTAADIVKAVRHRDWPTVMQGLGEGIDPASVQVHGDPLIVAVTAIGPVRVVQAVLKAGADPDATNHEGETALFVATDPKVVELLLKTGANPNHVSKAGTTPLHVLASRGLSHAMDLLIQAGAQPNMADDEGRTPLVAAVGGLKAEAVDLLLRHQSDLDYRDPQKNTLLHLAVRQRIKPALAIAELLASTGAHLEARNADDLTPLLVTRTPEAVELLIRAGADVNAATKDGLTPLVRAVRDGDAESARLLLQAKANPDRRVSPQHPDKAIAGHTAAELAAASKSQAMRELFMGQHRQR